MIAFNPKGNLASFTGASSAPTSVQSLGPDSGSAQQYVLTNIDPAIDCVVGWGQSDAEAKLNAAGGSAVKCYWLQHSSQVVITAAAGAYFSGITSSSTAVVKVQAGIGN
jgi:hypothetical protein